VLACRLIERGFSVTLLEAGPRDWRLDFRIHMPAALSHVLSGTSYNWNYTSEPESGLNDRRIFCPRGRTLGGSSSINGMVYVRGHRSDFDRWAELSGYDDWRFEACAPYFIRAEDAPFGDPSVRGIGGPLHISRGNVSTPLVKAFLQAGQQAGHTYSNDLNGVAQEGVGPFDKTTWQGQRWSTSRAYLDRVRTSSRLSLKTGCTVRRVFIEAGQARGVEVDIRGNTERLYAEREVILCAGAINSPQILMLSGIGDGDELASLGIPVVQHLQGVGKNLQDHLEVYVQRSCKRPVSIYPLLRWYNQAWVGLAWYLLKRGPGATNHFEAGGFIRSDDSVAYPDLQMHFLPIAMNYDGSETVDHHGFQVHVGPMKPTSRGAVSLVSNDPYRAPRILFNYASTETDRRVMRNGIAKVREILRQPAFADLAGEELVPAPDVCSDEDIDRFVSARGESAYHPCGTCRMGQDDNAVVDNGGRVHGIAGLRVVDASIMPEITNGNLNAPVIMLAEKIAAAID